MSKVPFSVVYIVGNEEDNLGRSIESVLDAADEIIVVDSGSTDRTLTIAESYSARIFQIEWPGYGQAKNYGIDQAVNEWVLSLDADECIDPELASWLRHFDPEVNSTYAFRRINYIGGRLLSHALPAQWKLRLFPKELRWDDKMVHEDLIIPDNMRIERVSVAIHHFSYATLDEYRERNGRYADLARKSKGHKSNFMSVLGALIRAGFQFLKKSIFQGAILDGKYGYVISLESARYTYKKYA